MRKLVSRILAVLLFLFSIGIVTSLMPEIGNANRNYQIEKAWKYDNLYSPATFPILKPAENIEKEKRMILNHEIPFFSLDNATAHREIQSLIKDFEKKFPADDYSNSTRNLYNNLETIGTKLMQDAYDRGIFSAQEMTDYIQKAGKVKLINKRFIKEVNYADIWSEDKVKNWLTDTINKAILSDSKTFDSLLISHIHANVHYDSSTTNTDIREKLADISETFGAVESGELIVSRGQIIDTSTYQKLLSYDKLVNSGVSKNHNWFTLSGYLILSFILFLIFGKFLKIYAPEVFSRPRQLLFILLLIIGQIFLTSWAVRFNIPSYYAIPFCIIPIILRTFFGTRLALYAHLLTVMLASFIIPLGNEFTVLTIMAGLVAIFTNIKAHYWSQFFTSLGLILATYIAGYLSIHLLQTGTYHGIKLSDIGWLGVNVFLTLLAYPLIPLFEKLFGVVSDISLFELQDMSKPLLKRLSVEAPGTFQHSMMLANITESIARSIGANELLTKVGSLYHDIGKLDNPKYFIENQRTGENPHKDLSFEESANIIIAHVKNGVRLARKNRIPKEIQDFIRTHHGTSRVEYFYRSQLNNDKSKDIDESLFRYPGPKPTTKEMAILMMADTVEAASRSLKNPTTDVIDELIDKLIKQKKDDQQLSDADITYAEITKVKAILKKLMHDIYHARIEYPEDQT